MLKKLEGAQALKIGKMREFKINGNDILVIRQAEKLYAMSAKCPHLGCHLIKGTLKNNIITCPCHHSSFDINSGQLLSWIPKWPKFISTITKTLGLAHSLKKYKIVSKGNENYIDL